MVLFNPLVPTLPESFKNHHVDYIYLKKLKLNECSQYIFISVVQLKILIFESNRFEFYDDMKVEFSVVQLTFINQNRILVTLDVSNQISFYNVSLTNVGELWSFIKFKTLKFQTHISCLKGLKDKSLVAIGLNNQHIQFFTSEGKRHLKNFEMKYDPVEIKKMVISIKYSPFQQGMFAL